MRGLRSASGTLVIFNALIFLLMEIFGLSVKRGAIHCGIFIPPSAVKYIVFGAQVGLIVSKCGEWFRLLTALFVHGGILHIAFNMYALYYLGSLVEFTYGVWRFLAFYFLSGLAGNIATQFFYPSSISLGASGAIFGLAGVLLTAAFRSDSPIFIRGYAGLSLLPMIVFNIAYGFIPGSGINNAAHIGGLVSGMILGYTVRVPYYPAGVKEIVFRMRSGEFWRNPWYRNLRREAIWMIVGAALSALVLVSFILLIPSSLRILRGW